VTTGWFPNSEWLRKSLSPCVLLASGILCWAVLTLLLALQPVGSDDRFFMMAGACWLAQVCAAVALLLAARRVDGVERRPWMLLGGAVTARRKGDPDTAGELLERAIEAVQEAGRDLARPLDELRAATGHGVVEPAVFFREWLEKLAYFYGMETHEDLAAPLEQLGREEILVAYQVFVEAVWNAVKHSGAKNFWLSAYRERDAFVLRMRDDGRGYELEKATGGIGFGLMRSRVTAVGAAMRVESVPGEGTMVELRFGR